MKREHSDPTNTRQRWATPQALVTGIEALTGIPITLDVCAEAWSAKAPMWFGPGSPWAEDALTVPWGDTGGGARWCNPPYASIDPWAAKALPYIEPTWLLVPARHETRWWTQLVRHPEAWLTSLIGPADKPSRGRVRFLPPPGVEESSPSAAVVLWQIGGGSRLLPECVPTQALLDLGSAVLAKRTKEVA